MAPKKKKTQPQQRAKDTSLKKKTDISHSSSSSSRRTGPSQVQLSAENGRRLLRLLRPSSASPCLPPPSSSKPCLLFSELDRQQAARRLCNIYDTLASEGFTSAQIELCLHSLPLADCTLEASLDWLCLNIPGEELPVKFSSGALANANEGGSVQLLSSAKHNEASLSNFSMEMKPKEVHATIPLKDRQQAAEDIDRDSKNKQAEWIRQYIALQEEGSESDSETASDWEVEDPAAYASSLARDLQMAKRAAMDAKDKKETEKQKVLEKSIRELKMKMLALGLSENDFQKDSSPDRIAENEEIESMASDLQLLHEDEKTEKIDDDAPVSAKESSLLEKETDVEEEGLLGMFDEDSAEQQYVPVSVVEFQKKEKAAVWAMKADPREVAVLKGNKMYTQPKALLQQQCQKNGWEVPKYEKLSGRKEEFSYSVTIARPTSGRGKSKKVGGIVSYTYPEQTDGFPSIEEAQNAVATWALFCSVPELPLYQLLSEPYSTMCLGWHTKGKSVEGDPELERNRRSEFVKSLVNMKMVQDGNSNSQCPEEQDIPSSNSYPQKESKQGRKSVYKKEEESDKLWRRLIEKENQKEYMAMLKIRGALPIASVKQQLLKSIEDSEVVVVCGETGSGKSTQVPQYILEEMIRLKHGGFCNIICTQPRRIAAISVAERVAAEQCDASPGSEGSLVGYQVRLDSAWNAGTKLLFCTTGILLRKLAGDRDLVGVSHIIVDEVHERSLLGDFILIILKDLLIRRKSSGMPPLKVILMSATVDAQLFSSYFGNCSVILVEGRTFPVRSMFLEDIYELLNYKLASDSPAALINSNSGLAGKRKISNFISREKLKSFQSGWGDESTLEETVVNPFFEESLYHSYSLKTRDNLAKLNEDVTDYDLLEELIRFIDETGESGAILVFLPGIGEVQSLLDRLSASRQFSGAASDWVLPLHSSVSMKEQRKAFQSPPQGTRKIVIATNIAETSITIDDIVHVIDCGKHKEIRYNARRRMSSLVEVWISQANAKQRQGRAGRVKPGNCYCAYTRQRLERLMPPYQVPEMLRVPLIEICLQIQFLSFGSVVSFLQKALDPPRVDAIESAISTLCEVGALNEKEELTALGHHLAKLPVDVHIGKMMLYGTVFQCLSPILTIAACLSHKSPFSASENQKSELERVKQKFATATELGSTQNIARGQQSDHLAMVIAYNSWFSVLKQRGAKAAYEYCKSNCLNISALNTLREMRVQFATLLADIGFLNFSQALSGKARRIDEWVDDYQKPFNANSQHASVVKAVMCAGLFPNVAAMDEESIRLGHASALSNRAGLASSGKSHWRDDQREVFIHPSSLNHTVSEFRHPFLLYHEKVETSKVYIRDTTIISPYALLLFGGPITVHHQIGIANVSGWLKMNCPAQTAVYFKELRIALDAILQQLIKNPQGAISTSAKEVVPAIIKLLVDEDVT